MNKIIIKEDYIEYATKSNEFEVSVISKNEFFDVNTININIHKNTSLKIEYTSELDSKLDLKINVSKNATAKISEYRKGSNYKVRYSYSLDDSSNLIMNKFYDLKSMKEYVIINLNGENANIDYNFKTISTGYEKYDLTIYHNKKNTISNIKNNGINIEKGNLFFNVSSFVYENCINCSVDQNSRIINLVDEKCGINPNLFIDEFDVNANHAAHIGKFSNEEMFYLNSRGISDKDAEKLLINGFLTSNVDKNLQEIIEKTINKYWR